MFDSGKVQFFTRLAKQCPDRSDSRLPIRAEHFPVQAKGHEIVTRDGAVIASAIDSAMSEEIARRLNQSDFSAQEDQWAL